jgi:hypothetical protein
MAVEHMSETTKHVADAVSIAALFTIVWTGFRIYETDTVQKWLGKK